MKITNISILLCLFLFNFTTPTYSEDTLPSPIQTIEEEMEELQIFKDTISSRDKDIHEFSFNFSKLITQIAITKHIKTSYEQGKKKLHKTKSLVFTWKKDAGRQLLKIDDYTAIITQLQNIIKNPLSNKNDTKYRAPILKGRTLIKKLNKHKKIINNHIILLDKYLKESTTWENFLQKKIQQHINIELFNWDYKHFLTSPVESIRQLDETTSDIFKSIAAINYVDLITRFLQKIILSEIIFLLSLLFFLFIFSKMDIWRKSFDSKIFDPNFKLVFSIFLDNSKTLSFLISLLLWDHAICLLIPEYPTIIHFITITFSSLIIWRIFGRSILNIFIDEMNKSKNDKPFSFSSSPIYLFIILKSIQVIWDIENDFILFPSGLLLGFISYKLLHLSLRYRIYVGRFASENFAFFIKTMKMFLSIFMGAILFSVLLEIIGLKILGRTIQLVVLNDILTLALGWGIYQFINIYLGSIKNKIKTKKKLNFLYYIFDLLKNFLNTMLIIIISIIIIKSWAEGLFFYYDISSLILFKIRDHPITIKGPIYLTISYYAIRFLYLTIIYFLEDTILHHLNMNKRHSPNIKSILKYLLILLYISIALAILGVTYQNLIIFASALGVGIGFGLQNIVNNFISGIILLFEQPIRVGDVIEVNGFFSTVIKIGMRSTIVESLDNANVIIPNSEIISNNLTNWTLNNNIIAIKCDVGVAYGTDSDVVTKILTNIAKKYPNTLSYPEAQIWFTEFAESSLNFVLKIWIDQPTKKFIIKSDLMHEINRKFKEENITIPFPQQDIYIKQNIG